MEAQIRMAQTTDIENLIRLRFAYFQEENWEVTAEQRALLENNLRQYFTTNIGTDFFAAFVEMNGQIVATAFLAIAAMPANLSFLTGKTGTILNVFTLPEQRRKGYATQALQLLIAQAQREDLSYIELSASAMGKPLYEKLGFREKGQSHFTDMRLVLV